MIFSHPLVRATFLRREKRFFVYAVIEDPLDGTPKEIVAHTPNTGSMRGILDQRDGAAPVAAVWLTDHGDPVLTGSKRTLRYTLEIVEHTDGTLIGTHTGRTNPIGIEALGLGFIPEFAGWTVRPEARYDSGTRFDLLLTEPASGVQCWGEIKHVSLRRDEHDRAVGRLSPVKAIGCFPDSITTRGLKHLQHLTSIVKAGQPALQLYISQRTDVTHFTPAADIDPAYAHALHRFKHAGGHVVALGCDFEFDQDSGAPLAITVNRALEVIL